MCARARVCRLSYPERIAHAPYYIVICGMSGSTIFFYITLETAQISENNVLNIKYVF